MGIDGFRQQTITGADGVDLEVWVAGQGPLVVLLHGFPQTHLMWRHVAPALTGDFTVACPDLRGYGASGKPADPTGLAYAKRTMALDVLAVADALGHGTTAVVGHDRGAHVAYRAGLDHPERVTHVGILDILPTADSWEVLQGRNAAVAWHLFLMAQPEGLPEAMIAATADEFFGSFLDAWGGGPEVLPPDVRAEYLRASREAVPSIVADYRATAGTDLEHDLADRAAGRRLRVPVAVLQQDWGAELGFHAQQVWTAWADDLVHRTVDATHFMAESHPELVVSAVRELLGRG